MLCDARSPTGVWSEQQTCQKVDVLLSLHHGFHEGVLLLPVFYLVVGFMVEVHRTELTELRDTLSEADAGS